MPADDRAPFSGLLFVVQIIAVPLISAFLGMLLVEIYDLETGAREAQWLVALIAYAVVGLTEGYFTEKISGCAAQSGGRFVWAPLLCLIAIGILRDSRGPSAAISELLEITDPFSLKGLAAAFLTLPAWACCCYSFALTIVSHRSAAEATT